jgi:BirA family transcriptional regulator, biotin operon repressor / biotin---[acetyl-CoA-carboxylase] ligase
MLADGSAREGDWLVALSQPLGRGRQGRQWTTIEGNFAGSTLVLLQSGDREPQTLSVVAGLALIEAVDIAAPGRRLKLKWPNDLLLDGGKLAGVLLERSADRVAVGIGVNLAHGPTIEGRRTASLDRAIAPKAFAPLLAASFARWLDRWRTDSLEAIADAWLERAHPVGTTLTVHIDAQTLVSGRFEGLAADGALLLRTDRGAIETIRAGDVEL